MSRPEKWKLSPFNHADVNNVMNDTFWIPVITYIMNVIGHNNIKKREGGERREKDYTYI